MDPIGVIAAIGQVVDAISSLCAVWNFVNLVRGAPEEIRKTREELASHCFVLQAVHAVVKQNPQAANHFASLVEPNGPITQVKNAIAELHSIVAGDSPNRDPGDGDRTLIESLEISD
ncbi:hypothetical protein F4678DRAFT_209629 [Xylaria arbuscula]|nr:hypothetical protein F4678DRAFT_209629 [Xylaria arbuscula]